MSRSWQFVGLKPEATAWLDENVRTVREPAGKCPTCSRDGYVQCSREVISSTKHDSFYGEGPTLHVYRLKDGRKVVEVVQDEPWSSGPVTFLCLEVDGKRMFEWPQADIDEA
jgi:hypothetical protein